MSVDNKNFASGLPNLEVHSANEIVADRTHAWHAIRGYDFAGLEGILAEGLTPAHNQDDYCVCLSASPSVSHSVNREANSFYAYTLQDGLSLSIRTSGAVYPSGNHGGFVDELRRSSVPASEIDGVMLPSDAVNRPLEQVATVHEVRQPKQVIEYISRTLKHLSELGVQVDVSITEIAKAAI